MKIEIEQSEKDLFKPFKLILTVESAEEGVALRCIFNHVRICDVADRYMGADFSEKLRGKLDTMGMGMHNKEGDIWADLHEHLK